VGVEGPVQSNHCEGTGSEGTTEREEFILKTAGVKSNYCSGVLNAPSDGAFSVLDAPQSVRKRWQHRRPSPVLLGALSECSQLIAPAPPSGGCELACELGRALLNPLVAERLVWRAAPSCAGTSTSRRRPCGRGRKAPRVTWRSQRCLRHSVLELLELLIAHVMFAAY